MAIHTPVRCSPPCEGQLVDERRFVQVAFLAGPRWRSLQIRGLAVMYGWRIAGMTSYRQSVLPAVSLGEYG
ncbi:hypothetical protein [Streptomyces sp. NPDC059874]|uniref:hypothetical protein n=1 Tax=Streptomyces sp. NPDC059874 TaxID=3346983 RepID=UPI00366069A9